jgi:hypothetical protein
MFHVLNLSKQRLKRLLKCNYGQKQLHGVKQDHVDWMGGPTFRPIVYKINRQIWV